MHLVSEASRRNQRRGIVAWSVDARLVERERILRGWTLRELARNAHVDPGTLSDLLGRRRRPTFGTVQAICRTLNLSLHEVITFEPDEPPTRSAC